MKTAEEIWAKWRKTWIDDGRALTKDPYVLKAMQEYAEAFHKEKLREELKAFNNFVLKLVQNGLENK